MKDKSPQYTKENLVKHYGESAPSIRTIHEELQKFCESTSDGGRSRYSVHSSIPQIMNNDLETKE